MQNSNKTEFKNKILFILPHLNGGGAERVSLNYLRNIDHDRFEVVLIVFDKTFELLHLIPEDVTLIDLNTKRVSKSFFKLVKSLRVEKPDFVFTTHYTVAFLLSMVKFFVSKFQHLARIPGSPKSEKHHNYYGSLSHFFFDVCLFKRNSFNTTSS